MVTATLMSTLKLSEQSGFDRRVQNRKDSFSPSFLHTSTEPVAHDTIPASVWCVLILHMHYRTNQEEPF